MIQNSTAIRLGNRVANRRRRRSKLRHFYLVLSQIIRQMKGMIGMQLNEIKTEYDVLKHGLLMSVAVTNIDLTDEQRTHYLDLLKRFEHAAKQIDDKALSKLKGSVMQAIYASQAYLLVNNRTVKRNAKRECLRAKKVLERTKAREE